MYQIYLMYLFSTFLSVNICLLTSLPAHIDNFALAAKKSLYTIILTQYYVKLELQNDLFVDE